MLRNTLLALAAVGLLGYADAAKADVLNFSLDDPDVQAILPPGSNVFRAVLTFDDPSMTEVAVIEDVGVFGSFTADVSGLDGPLVFTDMVSDLTLEILTQNIDLNILGTVDATLGDVSQMPTVPIGFRLQGENGSVNVTGGSFDLQNYTAGELFLVVDQGAASLTNGTGVVGGLINDPEIFSFEGEDSLMEDVTAFGMSVPGTITDTFGSFGDGGEVLTIDISVPVVIDVEDDIGVNLILTLSGTVAGATVPEPSTYALVGVGLLAGGVCYRRRKAAKTAS